MDSIELTKNQESVVIDFIKRWGVDSPELVAEMLDHYCELATEEMANGREFQAIVNSWKTKATLSKLRRVQEAFSKKVDKDWRRQQWNALKWTLTNKPVLVLVPLYIAFYFLSLNGQTLYWLTILIGVKAVFGFALIIIKISLNKRRRRIDRFKKIITMGAAYWIIIYNFLIKTPEYSATSNVSSTWAAGVAFIFTATVVLDFMAYRLFKDFEQNSAYITNEIVEEFKLQR